MAYATGILYQENPSDKDNRSISEGFFITINQLGFMLNRLLD